MDGEMTVESLVVVGGLLSATFVFTSLALGLHATRARRPRAYGRLGYASFCRGNPARGRGPDELW